MKTGVQQIMLGTVTKSAAEAKETLRRIKAAGYDGLEVNRFMLHPSPIVVRLLTKAAGMPTGKGGKLNWNALIKESGLEVVSLHSDLGSLEREGETVAEEAKALGAAAVVITGMYRFDYADEAAVRGLADRLNRAGETLNASSVPACVPTTCSSTAPIPPLWALSLTATGSRTAAPTPGTGCCVWVPV